MTLDRRPCRLRRDQAPSTSWIDASSPQPAFRMRTGKVCGAVKTRGLPLFDRVVSDVQNPRPPERPGPLHQEPVRSAPRFDAF